MGRERVTNMDTEAYMDKDMGTWIIEIDMYVYGHGHMEMDENMDMKISLICKCVQRSKFKTNF
jgi:hypothetical protein